jgi:redox-sensitive bicupin YhaK (pirin superfamily)
MTAPRYQELVGAVAPTRREPGVEVRVFSGESGGVIAPTKNYVPVTMIEIRLDAFANVLQDLPADFNAVIVVLDGETIAAFLNTGGGTPLIGIADDGSLVGLSADGFCKRRQNESAPR